jgi:hypothetical protein
MAAYQRIVPCVWMQQKHFTQATLSLAADFKIYFCPSFADLHYWGHELLVLEDSAVGNTTIIHTDIWSPLSDQL